MAELTLFSYKTGRTILHETDARVKLLSLVLICLSVLRVYHTGLTVLSCFLALLVVHIRMPILKALAELKFFLMLVAVIWITRAVSLPGNGFSGWPEITPNGAYEATMVCWRLVSVVISGALLVSSTKTWEIKAAMEWFLRPLPGVNEKKLSTMVGLTVRFIPLILVQAEEIDQAHRARGIPKRKTIFRLMALSTALIRKVVLRADHLVCAMESRRYTDDRTPLVLSAAGRDYIVLFAMISLCFIVVFLLPS